MKDRKSKGNKAQHRITISQKHLGKPAKLKMKTQLGAIIKGREFMSLHGNNMNDLSFVLKINR